MSGRIKVARVDSGPLWSLSSSYFSPKLVSHAKAVPGISFDSPTRSWRGYVDAVAAVVARLKTEGIRVEGSEDLPASDSWRTARTPFLFATSGLREYQVEGVRFLIAKSREGALLADGMRLGKSCMSLTAARALKQKTLIVCPAHVVGVWGRPKDAPEGPGEIAKWWPEAWRGVEGSGEGRRGHGVVCLESVKPAKATPAELQILADGLETAQVIVCHYDIIYAWVEVLKLWGLATLILDEAHIIAGYQSQRSDALKELAAVARNRILLTGTPVVGALKTAHNMLEILSPKRFGYFFIPPPLDSNKTPMASYARVFCDSHQETVGKGEAQKTIWNHMGRSNTDEPDGKTAITQEETLQHRLKYLMLRRLKRAVDPQLPQKTRQIIDVAIPARQAIGVSAKTLGTGGAELRRCLDLAADGKLRAVVDLVASHAHEGEKVICGCYRRLFAERVAADVAKKAPGTLVEFIHGGLTQRERERRIHRLRSHEGPSVLAGTIDTISTGIDLSFAGVMVVAEFTWEWHDLDQLEERLYSFGDGAKALVQYVVARGTGDELIVRGIISKMGTSDRVVGTTGSGLKEDLAKKKANAMNRLHAALVEMQKAKEPVTKTRRIRA